jgi:hypothetical protein
MLPESVALAVVLIVAAPERVMALSMVVAPVIARVAPAASVTPPEPRLLSEATLSVPALTVVVPL